MTEQEINDIRIKVENIDTKMDSVIEFKNMIHTVVFGNGNPGLKGHYESLVNQVNKQWGILAIVLTAMVTGIIVHYWRG